MKASGERSRLLYEIASSVGTSLDLTRMLRKSLGAFLKKLDCSAGGVYCLKKSFDGKFWYEPIYLMPESAERGATFKAAFKHIPFDADEARAADFAGRLPMIGDAGGGVFHILELPGFGLLVLVSKNAIDPATIKSLKPVLRKLAVSSDACLKNKLLTENESELQRYLFDLESYAVKLFRSNEDLKRAKNALKESEERFRGIASAAMDAIVQMNENGNIAYWNPGAEKMFGYMAEEAFGKELHVLLSPKRHHESYRRGFMKFRESGRGPAIGRTLEFTGVRKDGTEFPIEVSPSALNIRGQWHSVAIIRDISERKRNENILQASEERFRSVAQTASDAIISVDGGMNIIFWNRMAEKIFGYSSVEVEGCKLTSVIPEKYREAFLLRIEKIASSSADKPDAGSGGRSVELMGRRKDGGEFPAEFSFASWKARGEAFYTAIIRDITDRRRAENELLLLQGINNAVNIGIPFGEVLRMAAEGVRVLFDYNVCDIFLLDKEQRRLRWAALSIDPNIQKTIEALTGADAREHGIPLFEGSGMTELVESRKSYVTDDIVKIFEDFTDDERLKPFAGEAARIAGFKHVLRAPLVAEEEVIGVIGVGSMRAISKPDVEVLDRIASQLALVIKKGQIERGLRESEERFRRIFEQNEDAILMFEPETFDILDANSQAVALFGYSKTELMKNGHSLFCERAECGDLTAGLVIDRKPCTRADGTEIIVSVRGKIIRLQEKDVLYCSFRDITEKLRLEEESKARRAQLLHASKMTSLGTLVSGVAHEVNNPNNFIMFNTPLISSAWHDALKILEGYYRDNGDFSIGGLPYSEMKNVVPKLLSGITEGSARIKDIVDNLKDFARPDRASTGEAVDLNGVVSSSISILGSQIRKHTDNFGVEFAEDLPLVRGNARQLEQVVINLIMNALEALPGRERGVSVSTAFGEGEVAVEVRDEGAGIERENLERVTEPFFTTKLDRGGTGLGLSVSYSIVKEHGGSLRFESGPGIGTKAILRLPPMGRA